MPQQQRPTSAAQQYVFTSPAIYSPASQLSIEPPAIHPSKQPLSQAHSSILFNKNYAPRISNNEFPLFITIASSSFVTLLYIFRGVYMDWLRSSGCQLTSTWLVLITDRSITLQIQESSCSGTEWYIGSSCMSPIFCKNV